MQREGPTALDAHIAGYAHDAGLLDHNCVQQVGRSEEQGDEHVRCSLNVRFADRMKFLEWAPVRDDFGRLKGQRVENLLPLAVRANEAAESARCDRRSSTRFFRGRRFAAARRQRAGAGFKGRRFRGFMCSI